METDIGVSPGSEGSSLWLVVLGLFIVIPIAISRFDHLASEHGGGLSPVLDAIRVRDISNGFAIALVPYIVPIILIYAALAGALLTGVVTIDLERVYAPVAQVLVVFGVAGVGARTEVLVRAEGMWRRVTHRMSGIPQKLVAAAQDLDRRIEALVSGSSNANEPAVVEDAGDVARLLRSENVANVTYRMVLDNAPELASDFELKHGKLREAVLGRLEICLDTVEQVRDEILLGQKNDETLQNDGLGRKIRRALAQLGAVRLDAAIYLIVSQPNLSRWNELPQLQSIVSRQRERLHTSSKAPNVGAWVVAAPCVAGAALGRMDADGWSLPWLYGVQFLALYGISAIVAVASYLSSVDKHLSGARQLRIRLSNVAFLAFVAVWILAALINIASAASQFGVDMVRDRLGLVVYYAFVTELPQGTLGAVHAFFCLRVLIAANDSVRCIVWITFHVLTLVLVSALVIGFYGLFGGFGPENWEEFLSKLTRLEPMHSAFVVLVVIVTDLALVRYAQSETGFEAVQR